MKRFLRRRRKQYPHPKIRWIIRRDLPEILTSIERPSFKKAWNSDEFTAWLDERTIIAMVAELKGRIVGYMIYELRKTTTVLWKLAVHPKFRRRHVGQAMLRLLVQKTKSHARTLIVHTNPPDAPVNDPAVAQKFFVACDSWNGMRQHAIRIAT